MLNAIPNIQEHEAEDDYHGLARVGLIFNVSVKIRRNYGDVELEYGLEARYVADNFNALAPAYDEIRTVVETQLELAMKNRPELIPGATKTHVSQNEATVFCTHVRKENVNGKIRVRLLGGEYSTHGIACYPEFFEALELYPDTLDYGDTPYNHTVIIQLDGHGNPKRAVKVVPQS